MRHKRLRIQVKVVLGLLVWLLVYHLLLVHRVLKLLGRLLHRILSMLELTDPHVDLISLGVLGTGSVDISGSF